MNVSLINSANLSVRHRLICRGAKPESISLKVRYGLIDHPDLGPILIDAGYAPRVVSGQGRGIALRTYGKILSPNIAMEGHPEVALGHLGYRLEDVQHVILTHLHADHVGYLDLFPHARIHTSQDCIDLIAQGRALSLLHQGIFRELLPAFHKSRFSAFETAPIAELPRGLACDRLPGRDVLSDGTVLATPLPGHAIGHYGLYFKYLETPFLYAVDTSWSREALLRKKTPALPASLVASSWDSANRTEERVRQFAALGGKFALCHEPGATPWDTQTAPCCNNRPSEDAEQ